MSHEPKRDRTARRSPDAPNKRRRSLEEGFFGTKNTSGHPSVTELKATHEGSQSRTTSELRHDALISAMTLATHEVSLRHGTTRAANRWGSRNLEIISVRESPQRHARLALRRARRNNTCRCNGRATISPCGRLLFRLEFAIRTNDKSKPCIQASGFATGQHIPRGGIPE